MTSLAPARPRLVLDGVSKRFPTGTVALTDVSLILSPGDFVSVVGPSGCGKSTLLRLASGLDDATGGRVEVEATSTSYVFQDPTLLEWRTAARNVELVQELSGVPREERRRRAQEVLDIVGLTGFGKRHPRQLSGGMRMRVSLARALVAEPDLGLFDEPNDPASAVFGQFDPARMKDTVTRFVPLLQASGTLSGPAPAAESLYANQFIDKNVKLG